MVVTRARAQASAFVEALEYLGAEVIAFPTIEIVPVYPLPDLGPPDRFDWVVFTSANGVRCLEAGQKAAANAFSFGEAKVCAVGPATNGELEGRGVRVDLVPEAFDAESVLEALKRAEKDLGGKRFLLPRGDIARDFLPAQLRELGAKVTEAVVYRTVCPEVSDEARDGLVAAGSDMVTFTSASCARHYVQILGPERLETLGEVVYASIGPQTTQAAEQAGLKISIEPDRHDADGLVEAIVEFVTT